MLSVNKFHWPESTRFDGYDLAMAKKIKLVQLATLLASGLPLWLVVSELTLLAIRNINFTILAIKWAPLLDTPIIRAPPEQSLDPRRSLAQINNFSLLGTLCLLSPLKKSTSCKLWERSAWNL